MLAAFKGLSKLVRIVLLVVPFVNWIVELILRWSLFLEKKDLKSLVVALVATFGFGVILGWVDAIWTYLHDTLVLLD